MGAAGSPPSEEPVDDEPGNDVAQVQDHRDLVSWLVPQEFLARERGTSSSHAHIIKGNNGLIVSNHFRQCRGGERDTLLVFNLPIRQTSASSHSGWWMRKALAAPTSISSTQRPRRSGLLPRHLRASPPEEESQQLHSLLQQESPPRLTGVLLQRCRGTTPRFVRSSNVL